MSCALYLDLGSQGWKPCRCSKHSITILDRTKIAKRQRFDCLKKFKRPKRRHSDVTPYTTQLALSSISAVVIKTELEVQDNRLCKCSNAM